MAIQGDWKIVSIIEAAYPIAMSSKMELEEERKCVESVNNWLFKVNQKLNRVYHHLESTSSPGLAKALNIRVEAHILMLIQASCPIKETWSALTAKCLNQIIEFFYAKIIRRLNAGNGLCRKRWKIIRMRIVLFSPRCCSYQKNDTRWH